MGSKVLGGELTSGLDLKGEQELGKAIPSRRKERIKGSQLRRVKQNQQHWLGSDFEETYLLQVLFPKEGNRPSARRAVAAQPRHCDLVHRGRMFSGEKPGQTFALQVYSQVVQNVHKFERKQKRTFPSKNVFF